MTDITLPRSELEQAVEGLEAAYEGQIWLRHLPDLSTALRERLAQPEQEPESFEQWNAKQHGDPEEIGFLQALRVAYCAGQDSMTAGMTRLAQPEQMSACPHGVPHRWLCEICDQPEHEPATKAGDLRAMKDEFWKQPEQEPMLTVDALRVEFERPYKGRLGLTRLSHGNYLCPAIDKEWQQFVSKYTPPQRPWAGSGDLEDSNAYLTTTQRTWVELTDADIDQVSRSVSDVGYAYERALLAKFKEKNT